MELRYAHKADVEAWFANFWLERNGHSVITGQDCEIYLFNFSFCLRRTEQLLCILAVLDSVVFQLEHIEAALVAELQNDLYQLLWKHPWVPIVGAACRAFCTLASKAASAADYLTNVTMVVCRLVWHPESQFSCFLKAAIECLNILSPANPFGELELWSFVYWVCSFAFVGISCKEKVCVAIKEKLFPS